MLEFVIVGRGLAGAVLYEVLRERGVRARVIDVQRDGSASAAAAGVVNPVVLRRIVLSWRAPELLPIAERFYRSLETRYGVKLWHPLPLVKIFSGEREQEEWDAKLSDPELAPFLSSGPPPGFDGRLLNIPNDCGSVRACAWLDVPALLRAQREELERSGDLRAASLTSGEQERSKAVIIDCTGPFAGIPGLVPVKGETLTVRIPGLCLSAMVNRGAFLLPLGDDLFRIGATFAWNNVWSGPSEEARSELLLRASRMTSLPVDVVEHRAGVRPAARDRRPILGRLAASPHQAVFNGLGSRGVLLAPWCAMHLADHLIDGAALDPEVDAARFAG